MVYIVSDERIAVENFEQGKIYKVDFVDESVLYGVCVGIGSDFVMLSGDISGYIFPLTMQTASQVTSIDLYTPIEPEPPISNLLQYQTGEPPFTFTTTDTSLFSWYIKGNMQQSGTPTPTNPIYPTECNISAIKCNNHTTSISCDPLCRIGDYTDYKSNSIEYRPIYKLVLTGQENWTTYEGVDNTYRYILPSTGVATLGICSHFTPVTALARLTDGTFLRGGLNYLYIRYDTPADITAFKAFLTAQYNNNTPVTVWYVLSTPTTTAAATPDITTDAGENELTVTADLQPSEMQIVYKIADR